MFRSKGNCALQGLDQAVFPATCDYEIVGLVLQNLMVSERVRPVGAKLGC